MKIERFIMLLIKCVIFVSICLLIGTLASCKNKEPKKQIPPISGVVTDVKKDQEKFERNEMSNMIHMYMRMSLDSTRSYSQRYEYHRIAIDIEDKYNFGLKQALEYNENILKQNKEYESQRKYQNNRRR